MIARRFVVGGREREDEETGVDEEDGGRCEVSGGGGNILEGSCCWMGGRGGESGTTLGGCKDAHARDRAWGVL